MNYVGVTLYVFWFLLTMFRFGSMPKNREFSYRSAIFGNIDWYHNLRTLLLIAAIAITFKFAPLKIIYLLIIISAIVLAICCIKNFFTFVGNPWIDLGLFALSILIAVLSSFFIVKF